MSMRKRGPAQRSMWVATPELPKSPGHVFCDELNRVLERGGFDCCIEEQRVRPYIAEPRPRGRRSWSKRPRGQQRVVYANRYRIRRAWGRRLGGLRSERIERSFAQKCETGGGRQSIWLVRRFRSGDLLRVALCETRHR